MRPRILILASVAGFAVATNLLRIWTTRMHDPCLHSQNIALIDLVQSHADIKSRVAKSNFGVIPFRDESMFVRVCSVFG